MPVYRVRKGQSVNHTGEILTEGMELDIPRHVAYELRNLLEATDEEGKLPEGPENAGVKAAMQQGMRAHEKLEVLRLQKADLEKKLKDVSAAMEAAEGEAKSEAEARQKRLTDAQQAQAKTKREPSSTKPESPAQEA